MKVGVIGAGVMGCAAAAALSKRGAKVQLFEREVIGAATSSSMGPSRIIRLTYNERDYIRLSQQAFAAWHRLEAEAGQSLLVETGGIDIADRGDPCLDRMANTLTAARIDFELWDDAELGWTYPQFASGGLRALFQPRTAVLLADRCVEALAALGAAYGALIHERTEVQEIEPSKDGVKVRANGETHLFDRIIVCAGPRTGSLLDRIGPQLPFTVSMEQSVYFETSGDGRFNPGRFPICIGHFDEHRLVSIFPAIDGDGIKMMIEDKSRAADPENFVVDQASVRLVEERARALMPALNGKITRIDRARYTLLPDEDFLVDRHPDHDAIIICSACSGHGFKFAPVIGEMVADIAEGKEAHPRFRFRPERFELQRVPA